EDSLVSIHAPVRGATDAVSGIIKPVPVSIHAPARGATALTRLRYPQRHRFNPRARTGRDWPYARIWSRHRLFQSTRPHGARHPAHRGFRKAGTFQSTRPHGARPSISESPSRGEPCFNPRARTGRDWRTAVGRAEHLNVSIHAPARGATPTCGHRRSRDMLFQSTRPHGARPSTRSSG